MVKLEYRTLEKNEYETIDYCTINGDRVSFDTYCKVEAELKKAKAFDIVVEKNIPIYAIKNCEDVDDYNLKTCWYNSGRLTQEEYDLLKEVLK